MKEYVFIYGKSFEDELKERQIHNVDKVKRLFREEIKKTTFHFGHPYLNSATFAVFLRIILKKYSS
jgi:hypothetical protein